LINIDMIPLDTTLLMWHLNYKCEMEMAIFFRMISLLTNGYSVLQYLEITSLI